MYLGSLLYSERFFIVLGYTSKASWTKHLLAAKTSFIRK